jgi:hypothetical protein
MNKSTQVSGLDRAFRPTYWHCLAELCVPNGADDTHQLKEWLAEAARPLHLPAAYREGVQTAVVEAFHYCNERGARLRNAGLVLLRLVLSVDENENGKPSLDTDHSDAAPLASAESARSWGFFLLERMAGPMQSGQEETTFIIELYLYHERRVGL